ncbi:MAG TPA: sigma 54-interacting transcriptional regulator, partial [Polyangia bacterium]
MPEPVDSVANATVVVAGDPVARAVAGAAKKVLVVDDEPETAGGLAEILREDGYHVDIVHSAEDALERFKADTYHLLLTDLLLPGKSGVELTKLVHDAAPATAIVLITGHATVKTAVSALKRGASDYIRKPVNPKKLRERVQTLLDGRPDYLPNKMLAVGRSGVVLFEGMMARSRVMHNVFEKIKLAAQSDATVLITGESGTGKELVARAIHMRSKRAQGPFVAVHTGAIPRELIASELFGHERGSFTGAVDRKEGKFELAENGTIFLDEISTMDERTQVNLLRVLESFAYMR